jgi:prevent-host-death family protein
MKKWPVQEAKARFSEFLEASVSKGPQIVTRRGVETAVLVPINRWRQLEDRAKVTLKDLLMNPPARGAFELPHRRAFRWRRIPELE